jgi:hypothetical protein
MTRFALVSALFRTSAILVALTIAAACHRASPTQPTPSPGEPPAPTAPVPPRDPQDGIKGHYVLTLQIGASCAIPEAEKTRTYDAWIDRGTNREYGGYVVTLGGASFFSSPLCTTFSGKFAGMGCNQFFASEDIDWVGFWLDNNNDEAYGGHIVERASSGGWLQILGSTGGLMSSYSFMETAGTGTIWYCPIASDVPWACSQSQYVACSSTDLRLTLKRK